MMSMTSLFAAMIVFLGHVSGGTTIPGGIPASIAGQSEAPEFDYAPYAEILSILVDEKGMVDYRRLREQREPLDRFCQSLGALDPTTFEGWNRAEQLSFWINSYNALTLKAIIDNYPIQPGFLRSFVYPRNSIRQIRGVWDGLHFPVLGRQLTLDEIEHGIIRSQFQEPRVHFALVCAAKGCPPLRREPYLGGALDSQLNEQTRNFLSSPLKFRIDSESRHVDVSPIFEWFQEDFVNNGSPAGDTAEEAVLEFIQRFLPEHEARKLAEGDFRIRYLDYDWSLNEQ